MNNPQRVPGDRRVVRVYAWFIMLTTLLTLGAAGALVASQPEEYTAVAEVELLETPTRGAPLVPDVGTEREVALAGTVARDAASRMDMSVRKARAGLSASAVTDTNVLVIEYTAATRRAALRGAEAFTRSYVDTRNALRRAPSVAVITEPELSEPGRSVSAPVILAAGLLVGVGLGTAGAFLWDRASDRVRSAGELRRSGVEVLATDIVVPADVTVVGTGQSSGRTNNAGYLAGRLTALTNHSREGVTILVSGPRDGSAHLAVLTAASLAGLGRRVVLVGADESPSAVDALADGAVTAGFADVLAGRCSPDTAMRATAVDGLRLLGAGPGPAAGAIDIDGLKVTLGQLSAGDIVVIAGPPLLTSAHGWLLAEHADVVLLAADLRCLRRRDAARAVDLLRPLMSAKVGWVVATTSRRHRSGADSAQRRAEPARPLAASDDPGSKVGGRPTT